MRYKFRFATIIILFHVVCAYGQNIKCQSSKYSQMSDNLNRDTHVMRASISCSDSCRLFVMFSEDIINDNGRKDAIRRKMLRRYNDFSLSMLAWEPNIIMDSTYIVPGPFAKLLEPGENFDIIFESEQYDGTSMIDVLQKHLLVFDISELDDCGCSNFIEGAKSQNFLYAYSFIVLNFDKFLSYMKRNAMKMKIELDY